MSIPSTPNLEQNSHRRASDNTPASRVAFNFQYSPTSPKIHELREKYITQKGIVGSKLGNL
jgi:hypothetical protein